MSDSAPRNLVLLQKGNPSLAINGPRSILMQANLRTPSVWFLAPSLTASQSNTNTLGLGISNVRGLYESYYIRSIG